MLAMMGLVSQADERSSHRDSANKAAAAVQDSRQNPSSNGSDSQEAYKVEREALREALAQELSKFGSRPSKDDVRRVVEDFQSQHEDAMAEQQAAAQELARDGLHEGRLEELSDFRNERSKAHDERRDQRRRYHEQLQEANSQEARDGLRDFFREDQRSQHDEIKSALKSLLREVRGGASTGNRRIDAP